MNEISQHIEYLVMHNDCVIVPGVGAFIARRFSAALDADGKSLLPPRREVAFNGSVTNDDGLLANSVARKEKLSFEEGRVKVFEYSRLISNSLREEGKFTIGNLGVLSRGEEGVVSFHPMARGLQVARGLGMCAIPVYYPDSASERKITGRENNRFNTDKFWYIPIHKGFARIAACFMLVFAVSASLFLAPGDGRLSQRHDLASVIPIETLNVEMKKVSESPIPVNTVIAEDTEDSGESDKIADRSPVNHHSKGKYCLIIATFKSPREVERYVSTLTDKVEVIEVNKLWRVSLGSSDVREDMVAQLSDGKVKDNYPGAWVWTRPAESKTLAQSE